MKFRLHKIRDTLCQRVEQGAGAQAHPTSFLRITQVVIPPDTRIKPHANGMVRHAFIFITDVNRIQT